MYNLKLNMPFPVREMEDVRRVAEQLKPKQTIIKKAEMETRQKELDLAAQEIKLKYDNLQIEKSKVQELAHVNALLTALSHEVNLFMNSRAIFYDEFNTKVATLAMAVAQKVIYDKIEIDDTFILDIVNNAIRSSGNDDELLIQVNPDDKKILEKHLPAIKKDYFDKKIKLEEHADIDKGSCIIATESGDIDARIDKQLEILQKSLIESFLGDTDGND